jgi:hypothetical protein
MTGFGKIFGILILGLIVEGSLDSYAQTAKQQSPRVFLMNAQRLQDVKQSLQKGEKTFSAAVAKIERDAQAALKAGTYSVTTKSVAPPSGDKHDYMSQAPYFWPDPKAKDGLPYVRRDGERNPEINKITDHEVMDDMTSSTESLALAYYFKGDEVYAAKAVVLLRTWFLDPATKMNPNLQFGQGIPGITTGRGIGLIETRGLTRVIDAVGLLAGSKALTETDKRGIEDWFGKFLTWMQESKNGKDEAASKNNHGTYYDVQLVSFALFTGRTDLAKKVLEESKQKRIALQIEPDGSQPLELERTKGWSYSVMNLEGLITLAELGDKVGVDLWSFQTKDGRGIRKSIDFLYPYAVGEKWKYQQIGEWPSQILYPLIRRASAKYLDDKFKAMMAKIPAADPASRENLVY